MRTRAVTRAAQGRRLPDELIVEVIEWCDRLADMRTATLASLCRVSKRYQEAAERRLYSGINLQDAVLGSGRSAKVRKRSAVGTLMRQARLRPLVKALYVTRDEDAETDLFAGLLGKLTNVEEVDCQCRAGCLQKLSDLLAHGNVRLRAIRVPAWDDNLQAVVRNHPHVFSALERVCLTWPTANLTMPALAPSLRALHISLDGSATFAAALAASCRDTLVHLRIPIPRSGQTHDFAGFRHLQSLVLAVTAELGAIGWGEAAPHLVLTLHSMAALTSLRSFAVEGRLVITRPLWGPPGEFAPIGSAVTNPAEFPSSSKRILAAIPPQIRHLSLVTSCFLADDVAAYLRSTDRPRELATLRIGDEVGRGVAGILGDSTGPFGSLADTLARAGVDVTTVGPFDKMGEP
ncbi:hypothetical protein DMC30DRAFT_280066 [Rhodotorula diobovata]|uniref:F-box domain-containing protein n=1 Tax=Rhodotorula diobovata TaxID=5288 RepID=A0A5C5G5K7_9BASI|nr:hypothetical protein DMC30DRAFT_280066 [Rhodotorula diobovata]